MKKCKHCKEEFTPYHFNQKYCFKTECKNVWIESEKSKQWKQTKKKWISENSTLTKEVIKAQKIVNTYIRIRDKGKVCISCLKPPKKPNAGHFWNANNHWSVRFDERNLNLQCEHCNNNLSGNLLYYRENLIKKIGLEEFNDLEQKAKSTAHFTIDQVKEIAKYYQEKINMYKK